MPKPSPVGFRRDVVAVVRKHEAPLVQISKDLGISEGHVPVSSRPALPNEDR